VEVLVSQGRQSAKDEKHRALLVIGCEDVNRKLDIEVNKALDPVDIELTDLRTALDAQLRRNRKLKVHHGDCANAAMYGIR